MLTGNKERVAPAVAASVGISEVRAGLLPEEKLVFIDTLLKPPAGVAQVCDGANDAPAMARATLGIAMGGAGCTGCTGGDVALETADVAPMADGLSRLLFAIALSRASDILVQQNLRVAVRVVALLNQATQFGWACMGIAVLMRQGATARVVLNAPRLPRFFDRADTARGSDQAPLIKPA